MHWLRGAARAAALFGLARRQDPPADSTVVVDAETGFTFGEYITGNGIVYRIARPDPVPEEGGFDVVLQVAAPREIAWAGMAWGGSMTYNPLTVAWRNDNEVVFSSRFAFGYYVPPPYDNTTYTLLPKGTHVNDTHWQYTIKCTGCTAWGDDDMGYTELDATAQNPLAFAFSQTPVDEPANNASSFGIHDSIGHWFHDFGNIGNAEFSEMVAKNSEGPATSAAGGSTGTPSTSTPTNPSSTSTAATTGSASSTSTASSQAPPTTSASSSAPSSASSSPTASSAPKPSSNSCPGVPAWRYKTGTADGWSVTKVAGRLTSPRSAVFDTEGNMLLLQSGLGVTVHTFGADGCVNSSSTVISNRNLNHGLALSPDGKTLYASSMTTAWRWSYDPATGKVDKQTVVIKGMNNGGHNTRSLYVVPNHPNLLLASVGSNANWDYAAESMAAGRAAVKVFDMDKVPDAGYSYATDGYQFGYGLRNEVGLAFDPNGMVWGVENGGDDFRRTINARSTDIHQDNPAEELNYLGDPTKPNTQWYGYPTCHTVWDPSLITDATFKTGDQFVVTPNTTYDDSHCATNSTPPRLAFQAHSAPITAAFDRAAENLYVSFHGSWDRNPATGYKVVQVPFVKRDGAYEPAASADSRDGYSDLFWSEDVGRCSSGTCLRPAAVVWDPSGERLVVSSDNSVEGELFVLMRTG